MTLLSGLKIFCNAYNMNIGMFDIFPKVPYTILIFKNLFFLLLFWLSDFHYSAFQITYVFSYKSVMETWFSANRCWETIVLFFLKYVLSSLHLICILNSEQHTIRDCKSRK